MADKDYRLLREFIQHEIHEIIKQCGDQWCLYTKHKKNGKRRRLGSHASKEGAEKQERAIKANGG